MISLKSKFINPLGFYEVKNSKFITYFYNLDSVVEDYESFEVQTLFKEKYKKILQDLKDEHKDAKHFVESFRILDKYEQITEGSSDDGEPSGSGGTPTLDILRRHGIVNVLCICVRYFGGVQLGVGGLMRAYTHSVLNALTYCHDNDLLIPYQKRENIIIEAKTANLGKIEYLAKKLSIKINDQTFFNQRVRLHVNGTRENLESLLTDEAHLASLVCKPSNSD